MKASDLEQHLTHNQLNDKHGNKCRFFELEIDAIAYKKTYRKRHPYRFCVIYPMRDAIMEVDEEKTKLMGNEFVYHKVVGYRSIGFLVSTPE